jgi:cation-transporting ATPase E
VDSQGPGRGLTSAQAAERAARGEVNASARRTSRPVAGIVRANVLTLFNAIIGTLCAVVLLTGRPQDALFGLVIVANTGIGVIQELRAKRTLDRLAVLGEEPVRVLRDGAPTRLVPQQIVLGDWVLIGPGDAIMVDGEVADCAGLEIDESLLTGEAEPVSKQPGERVLSGSFAVSGSGTFVATGIGRDSYAARLEAEAATFSLAQSELMAGINRFLRIITWVIVPVAALLTASQLVFASGAVGDAVSGAVAGIVTMIPEGLVLLTSVAFAVGVIRLGRRQCLVQQLPAIEVLARVDVLCLDKTGTLTEGGMELDEIVELAPGLPVRRVLAVLAGAEERPNATIQAIASGLGNGPDDRRPAAPGWQIARALPFSSARKWSGAVITGAGTASGGWVIGAPDVLLPDGDPARARAGVKAGEGLRVLLLGRADLNGPGPGQGGDGGPGPDQDRAAAGEQGQAGGRRVEPAALLVLRQRLRADAPRTLAYFAEQNVAVKVLSGDSAASVGAIARQLGIAGAEHPVDARTLPDSEAPAPAELARLAGVLAGNSVFGRVSPQQKRAFVTALQSRGHTVAMTGDGVNDVLALSRADLGVAMGSGSGATRAAAKIVLLDDSFATLPHVVAEGRRVLGNIERVASLFLTKTVYAMLLSTVTALVGFAAIAGLQGLRFPFLPRHLTLISTLTIGIPAFVLALAPSRQRAAPGFVGRVLRFAIPAGIACGAATFAAYLLARLSQRASLLADRTTAVITLSVVALWVLALVARPYTWWRIALVAAMAAGLVAALTLPLSQSFFALRGYDPASDVIAVVIAAAAGIALTGYLAATGNLPGSARSQARAAPPADGAQSPSS